MAEAGASLHRAENFHGLPSHVLTLPGGDALRVLEHGAHLVSWTCGGDEKLFLSSTARLDGHSAIRGGVPVCFPQFNQRGSLPKHGFARQRPWTRVRTWNDPAHGACLTLRLQDDAGTRAIWAHEFEFELTLRLRPGALDIVLDVHNTGARPLSFTGALHTYLRVADVAAARLIGLEGLSEWDALRDARRLAAPELRFEGEFDRVYSATPGPLELIDGVRRLHIAQSPSWSETVVWTPGAALAANLPDLPPPEAARMLCVEAAQVMQPVTLASHARWQGAQRLSVA